jgi:hypothetical protein
MKETPNIFERHREAGKQDTIIEFFPNFPYKPDPENKKHYCNDCNTLMEDVYNIHLPFEKHCIFFRKVCSFCCMKNYVKD